MTSKTTTQALLDRYGDEAGIKHAIANMQRRLRYRYGVVHHEKYELAGGPYPGQTVELSQGMSTAVFRVGEWYGRYESSGRRLVWQSFN